MSASFNPFVQGWENGGGSVFGALPNWSPQTSMPPDTHVFHITNCRPTIINSMVLNARGQQQYLIHTEIGSGRPTVWFDAHRRTVAVVDWGVQPSIEMPGLLPRTLVSDWLRISSNRSSRHMNIRGINYQWVPVDQYICLYLVQGRSVTMLARVTRVQTGATVELTKEAMQYGLLETSIVVTTLFLSGASLG